MLNILETLTSKIMRNFLTTCKESVIEYCREKGGGSGRQNEASSLRFPDDAYNPQSTNIHEACITCEHECVNTISLTAYTQTSH